MSLVYQFTVPQGQTKTSFRLQKAVQHLLITRLCTLAIQAKGILAALPEAVTAEITHPVRKRAELATEVPLSHMAAWAQFGRGPIVERASAAVKADINYGTLSASSSSVVSAQLHVYLNDNGPIEVLADDQFFITIDNLVPGATYKVEVPELPSHPSTSNQFDSYETSLVLADSREKTLNTSGYEGLILPNRPDAIERLIFTWRTDDQGGTKENEYTLSELLATQSDANPFYAVMNYTSTNPAERESVFSHSGESDLLVIDTKALVTIEIKTILGHVVPYTLVKILDRP